jgi:hypothetical protein
MTDQPEPGVVDIKVDRTAKSDMNNEPLPRPDAMSRQVHRRLYREACRVHKVEPKFARPQGKKLERVARKQAMRYQNDARPRGVNRNTSAKWINGITRAGV